MSIAPPEIASRKLRGSTSSVSASTRVSARFSMVQRIQLLTTSFSRVPRSLSPSQTLPREIAAKTGSHRARASGGPDASTNSCPSSAGFFVPSTGASTYVTSRSAASPISRSVAAMPIVLDWIQSEPADMASSPPLSTIVASTAGASASIVSTTSAPRTAAAGVSATWAPSSSSCRAVSSVRFQTGTSFPALSRLRAIGAPMIPVPSSVTRPTAPPFRERRKLAAYDEEGDRDVLTGDCDDRQCVEELVIAEDCRGRVGPTARVDDGAGGVHEPSRYEQSHAHWSDVRDQLR